MAIKKILELRGDDWLKGISVQPTLSIGGIFQQATNFNPFESLGYLQPSLTPTAATDGGSVFDKTIRYMVHVVDSTSKVYAYADTNNPGSTAELYEIDVITPAITDRSGQITTTGGARGAIAYRNFFVYALDTSIRARAIPITGGGNNEILTGLTSGEHPMTIGADLNLYGANGNAIFKISKDSDLLTTTYNSASVFALESGLTVKDVVSDGRYLIFIADDAASGSTTVSNCVIAFWDYYSGTLSQRYDIKDRGMVSVKVLDGNVYVFGQDNFYVCNVSTYPSVIMSWRGNSSLSGKQPQHPGSVVKMGNSILWGNPSSTDLWAYGSLVGGQKKIFYQPYTNTSGNCTAVSFDGTSAWTATSTTKVYKFNTGSTRSTSSVWTSTQTLDRPYSLSFIKIVAKDKLASGQSISVQLTNAQGSMGSVTFSYAADGAKQSKTLTPDLSGLPNLFNEITALKISSNAAIQSIQLWGNEADLQDQSI